MRNLKEIGNLGAEVSLENHADWLRFSSNRLFSSPGGSPTPGYKEERRDEAESMP
jgi:hypothetical protein